ncbi:MAG: PDZ domain-containing protein, partial [Myxococcota bacterium]
RRQTESQRSLDDVMRRAYALYSGDCGFTEPQFRAVVSEVAGTDMGPWLTRHLDGTEPLDYTAALEFFGLRFKPKEAGEGAGPQKDDPWFRHQKPKFGLTTMSEDGRLMIRSVVDGEPAANGGLNAGDEIIAIAGLRVTPATFEDRVGRLRAGEAVSLMVSRRDKIESFEIVPVPAPDFEWQIEIHPEATKEQTARRVSWLATLRKGV